jgi:hypothetical protein
MRIDKELINKQISIIVNGLERPCGGKLVSFDNDFFVLEADTGNTLYIPQNKITSILTKTEGIKNERFRKNN